MVLIIVKVEFLLSTLEWKSLKLSPSLVALYNKLKLIFFCFKIWSLFINLFTKKFKSLLLSIILLSIPNFSKNSFFSISSLNNFSILFFHSLISLISCFNFLFSSSNVLTFWTNSSINTFLLISFLFNDNSALWVLPPGRKTLIFNINELSSFNFIEYFLASKISSKIS